VAILSVLELCGTSPLLGQSQEELAKQLSNPVASLISFPLQQNFSINYKPYGGFNYTANIQPVIPFALNEKWNLINRTILPVVSQNNIIAEGSTQTGLGDIIQSLFFSPALPTKGGVIWGVGPAFLVPTATSSSLGTGKWGIGPTAVVLRQSGPWTYGFLVNHIWSFAGKAERQALSLSFLQPFLSRVYKGGFSWSLNSEDSYSWKGESLNGSFNLSLNQIISVYGQLISVGIGPRVFFGNASVRPRWGFRVNLTFLFPKN
jgi:hypothetical protein